VSLREWISKQNIANIVAAFSIVAAVVFAFWTKDAKLIYFVAGACLGYLFPKKATET